MEESFRSRADKIFGSLSTNPFSHSSSPNYTWRLSDEVVQTRERRRSEEKMDSDTLSHTDFSQNGRMLSLEYSEDTHELLENDLEFPDDESDDLHPHPQSKKSPTPAACGNKNEDEEWEVRSLIGLDPTLDEEEEDEYDNVAIGKENTGDRLYMNHVNDDGCDLVNSYTVLPTSYYEAVHDLRANRPSAMIKLPDPEAANKLNPLHDTATNMKVSENAVKLKSIMKRRDTTSGKSRSEKRVRFDPSCITSSSEEADPKTKVESKQGNVPDYMKNPSKYTRYALYSSSEVGEASNQEAYMDFLTTYKVQGDAQMVDEHIRDPSPLPKSLTFIPRRREGASEAVMDDGIAIPLQKGSSVLGIAAGYEENSIEEVSVMEEDGHKIDDNLEKVQRFGRHYRIKTAALESDDHVP